MSYDIIGDIHGHADALGALLTDLGYRNKGGAWRHPARQALFVGDFIDRGPKQMETVSLVRRMVDAGSARAVMGNHEFNAIAWFLPDPECPGEFLRKHHSAKYGDKNRKQHQAFLSAVEGSPLHEELVTWFLTLPVCLDLPDLRVIHACWPIAGMVNRRSTNENSTGCGHEFFDQIANQPIIPLADRRSTLWGT